jgi:crossover junction endodeoxyribonuclease RuvC
MFVLGVDIGNSGAVALIDEAGELLEVCDMPCLDDGPKGRPSVSAPLLAAIVARAGATQAYVEWVGPRPTDGAVQAFAFGRCKGVLEGVLAAAGVPVAFLTPPQWKRLAGIAPGKAGAKDAARSEAVRRWPSKAALFSRAKDDGRAEAALIAVAGLRREGERAHGYLPAGQTASRAIGAS